MPPLFRRRAVWVPTLAGTLLLLAIVVLAGAVLARHAGGLLAPHAPARGADGGGARTLIVEGWLDRDELLQAVTAARAGRYTRVLATGGPLDPWFDAGGWRSHALRTAEFLRANGLAGMLVIALPAPASAQERSYISALMVRDWAQQSGVALGAVDLYSAGAHARRSWLLYRMALGSGVEVGILAARPSDYDALRWWTSSQGVKTTIGEALSLAWTSCCFWPGAPGSHEERWDVPGPGPGASAAAR